jgi:hypothetical protein
MVLDAEANRMTRDEAERLLADVDDYASPFLRMPA